MILEIKCVDNGKQNEASNLAYTINYKLYFDQKGVILNPKITYRPNKNIEELKFFHLNGKIAEIQHYNDVNGEISYVKSCYPNGETAQIIHYNKNQEVVFKIAYDKDGKEIAKIDNRTWKP